MGVHSLLSGELNNIRNVLPLLDSVETPADLIVRYVGFTADELVRVSIFDFQRRELEWSFFISSCENTPRYRKHLEFMQRLLE